MKIRNGFVSNSSSSSFVLVGISCKSFTKKQKIELMNKYNFKFDSDNDIDEEFQFFIDENNFNIHDGEYDGVKGYVVGKSICEGDDTLESNIISISDMIKIGTEIREFFNIPESKEVKLYTGTRSC